MELEVTWGRAVKVWWSILWRNLLAIVAAAIVAGIIGFVLGLVFGLLGIPVEMIKLTGAFVGLAVGICISIVPVKLVLGKNYGEFRLVLLANHPGQRGES